MQMNLKLAMLHIAYIHRYMAVVCQKLELI